MKILITGAYGFVGNYLTHNMPSNYRVFAPSRSELDLIDTVAVGKYLDREQFDGIVHCALDGRNKLFSTDLHILWNNVLMFNNLFAHRGSFGTLVNLGTAYDVDLSTVSEPMSDTAFLDSIATTSYGMAKNSIARTILSTPNFYNLRLFGLFHWSEANTRFFKKLYTERSLTIDDREFSYFGLCDLPAVVTSTLERRHTFASMNVAYNCNKLTNYAKQFAAINNIEVDVSVRSTQPPICCNPTALNSLNLPFRGMDYNFSEYGHYLCSNQLL